MHSRDLPLLSLTVVLQSAILTVSDMCSIVPRLPPKMWGLSFCYLNRHSVHLDCVLQAGGGRSHGFIVIVSCVLFTVAPPVQTANMCLQDLVCAVLSERPHLLQVTYVHSI